MRELDFTFTERLNRFFIKDVNIGDLAVAIAMELPVYDMQCNWPGNAKMCEIERKCEPFVVIELNGIISFYDGMKYGPWRPYREISQTVRFAFAHLLGVVYLKEQGGWFGSTPFGVSEAPPCEDPLKALCRLIVVANQERVVKGMMEIIEKRNHYGNVTEIPQLDLD